MLQGKEWPCWVSLLIKMYSRHTVEDIAQSKSRYHVCSEKGLLQTTILYFCRISYLGPFRIAGRQLT